MNIRDYLRMLIEKDINPQSPRYLLNRFIKMQLDLELSSNYSFNVSVGI